MSISFNSQTRPIAPAIWTPPISAELYAQGFANQAKDIKEYQQNVQNSANDFLNIQAMSPQDQEVLDGYKQQFLKDVGNLNVGNLKTPQAKQQLNQYITQYASNPDILGIAQRSSALKQEQALNHEAELKGLKRISPITEQAQDYLQNGKYYTDQRFNKAGWVSPDMKEIDKGIRERLKHTEIYYNPVTHKQETREIVDPAQYQQALINEMKTNESLYKTVNHDFERTTKDIDFSNEGLSRLQEMQDEYNSSIPVLQQKALNAQTPEEQSEALLKLSNVQSRIAQIEKSKTNPSITGDLVKEEMLNSYISSMAEDFAITNDLFSTTKSELDELYKMKMDFGYDLEKMKQTELFKLKMESGIDPNTPENLAKAVAVVQANKLKNAQAANPNYKIVSSDVIEGYTEKNWADNVFVTKNGKTTIPDNAGAKNMIKKLIVSNPNKFPEIPQEVIETLQKDPNADIIDIINGDIEIDPSYWNPNAPKYIIKATDALQRKNEIVSPKNNEEFISKLPKGTITLADGTTVQAPVLTNVSDTTKLNKGSYAIVNGQPFIKE